MARIRNWFIVLLGLISGFIHGIKFIEFWEKAPVKKPFQYLIDGSMAIKFSDWKFTSVQKVSNIVLFSIISMGFIWVVTRTIELIKEHFNKNEKH